MTPSLQEFRLPDLGMAIEEAVIEEWLVGVGEMIASDQEIVLVSTDKANTSLSCPYSGTIHEIHVPPGEQVAIGTLLATILPA